MNRYQKHMQHVHNQATAISIEMAVCVLIEDIIEHLINSGVIADSEMVKNVRELSKYEYKQTIKA